MDTTMYYTFSTISQTLAGAFGFLVAVVLYQMQGLAGVLRDTLSDAYQMRVYDATVLQRARSENDWTTLKNLLHDAPIASDYGGADEHRLVMNENRDRFVQSVEVLEAIKNGLMRSLQATGFTIGWSLILLVATPMIDADVRVAYTALFVDVAAALFCLWTYFPLVKSVAK